MSKFDKLERFDFDVDENGKLEQSKHKFGDLVKADEANTVITDLEERISELEAVVDQVQQALKGM